MFIRTDYLRYFVENLKLLILAPSVDNEQIQIECFDFGQTVCFDFFPQYSKLVFICPEENDTTFQHFLVEFLMKCQCFQDDALHLHSEKLKVTI